MEKEGLPPCNTDDESKQEEYKKMNHDELIRFVFDHFRNIGICVTLVIGGGAIMKYRAEMPFGSTISFAMGIVVAVGALILFGWNAVYGGNRLIFQFEGKTKKFLAGSAVALYLVTIMMLLKATVMLYTDLQLKRVTPTTEIGASVKPSE